MTSTNKHHSAALELEILQKNWKCFCESSAKLLARPTKNAPYHSPRLEEASVEAQFSAFLTLMSDGIRLISLDPAPEARHILSAIDTNLQEAPLPDLSTPLEKWCPEEAFSQVDSELWIWAEAQTKKCAIEGDIAKATALFAILAFCQSSNALAWFSLAFTLYQQGYYQLTLTALHSAHNLSPSQPEFILLQTACYLSLDEPKKAQQQLQKAEGSIRNYSFHLAPEWENFQNQLSQKINLG